MNTQLDLGGSFLKEFELGCIGAVILDQGLNISAVSRGVLELGGYVESDLIGRSALDVVHPDDLERASEALFEAITTAGQSADGLYRLKLASGTYRDFAVGAIGLGPEADNASVFQFRAVPERLRAEEFARDSVEVLRLIAESQGMPASLERVHQITERHILGARLKVTIIEGLTAYEHRRIEDGTYERTTVPFGLPAHVEAALADHLAGPWRSFDRTSRFESLGGSARITSVLTDADNQLVGYAEITRPGDAEPTWNEWMVHGLVRQVLTAVIERSKLDEKLRRAAERDHLTGLLNRGRLLAEMSAAAELAGTTVIALDIDKFSSVNNTLGHAAGDEALVSFSNRLRLICPDSAVVARFGGDEFVIWLPVPVGPIDDLVERIDKIEVVVGDESPNPLVVSASVGAAQIAAGETPDDAIKRADSAMYRAKRTTGR